MDDLTLPPIAPPLSDVFVRDGHGTGLEAVRPLAQHIDIIHAIEKDERKVCQVDRVDLLEEVLPRTLIRCRQFLLVEGVQSRIAVEIEIGSIGR